MKKKLILAILPILILAAFITACSHTATARSIDKPVSSQPVQDVKAVQNIDSTEALNVVRHMINLDYTKYKIDLINDNLEYKGQQYYQFLISDQEVSIEPSIIVSKDDGEIYCYYPDKTVTEVYQDGVFKSKC